MIVHDAGRITDTDLLAVLNVRRVRIIYVPFSRR